MVAITWLVIWDPIGWSWVASPIVGNHDAQWQHHIDPSFDSSLDIQIFYYPIELSIITIISQIYWPLLTIMNSISSGSYGSHIHHFTPIQLVVGVTSCGVKPPLWRIAAAASRSVLGFDGLLPKRQDLLAKRQVLLPWQQPEVMLWQLSHELNPLING